MEGVEEFKKNEIVEELGSEAVEEPNREVIEDSLTLQVFTNYNLRQFSSPWRELGHRRGTTTQSQSIRIPKGFTTIIFTTAYHSRQRNTFVR